MRFAKKPENVSNIDLIVPNTEASQIIFGQPCDPSHCTSNKQEITDIYPSNLMDSPISLCYHDCFPHFNLARSCLECLRYFSPKQPYFCFSLMCWHRLFSLLRQLTSSSHEEARELRSFGDPWDSGAFLFLGF